MLGEHHGTSKKKRAHVIDVDMGYGHARAAYALKDLAGGHVISANHYPGIPARDFRMWEDSRKVYEAVSRLKPIPVIGNIAFGIMDDFQEIPPFYPRRDLSHPSIQLRQIYRMIKRGMGAHLIDQLRRQPLPIVTTFFTVAFMADMFGYPGEIYCVTTDADIARHWAPLDPKRSKIHYFAANGRCKERLQLYGVDEEKIHLTGFPLPKNLIGGYPEKQLQTDLMTRICNLDPKGIFFAHYENTIRERLGPEMCVQKKPRTVTLTFSVGGAGAQRRLGVQLLESLKRKILQHDIRLALFGGLHKDVTEFYLDAVHDLGLKRELGKHVLVPTFKSRTDYFGGFNAFLQQTDILMTKPSELSFYTGAGLPVLMAPPIGSQEKFNSVWLQYVGGGTAMMDPRYINEWLFDWIDSGGLARMAWNGYVEAPTHGTYRIEDVVMGLPSEIHALPLIV